MAYAGLPEGATVLEDQPQFVGLPAGATVFAGLPEGAEVLSEDPMEDIPIVPAGPAPELRSAPEQWQIDVHNAAHETLPALGGVGGVAGAGLLAIPTSGTTLAGTALAGGVGYAAGRKVAEGVDAAIGYRSLHPPEDAEAAMRRTMGDVITGAQLETGGVLAGGALMAGAGRMVGNLGPKSAKELDKIVNRGIQKGVRPTVVGKRTWKQRVRSMKRAGEAVKTIIANKQNLQFTDEAGEVVTGRLPKSLDEFSQAIDQTKGRIFQQYDDLAKAAGEEGARVNLVGIANDLGEVAGRKAMQDNAKNASRYALEQANTLAQRGTYTAQEAQEALRVINSRLDAFYKNPNPNMAQRAYVDSIVADRLRQALDDTITGAVGSGYQALKNQYGALKSIEREVNHRAVVAGRQNIRSITDFLSDLASAGHMARGALTGDPLSVAIGAAHKAVGVATKRANAPNRIITKMFADAEKVLSKTQTPPAWATTANRIVASKNVPPNRPQTPAEQGAGASALDIPTFRRQGRQLSEYEEMLARGHAPYLDQGSGQLALPAGAGFQAKGITPKMVPEEPLIRGHVPYSELNPAEYSARTFQQNLPQTPAAERAAVFEQTARGHTPVHIPEPPLPMPKSAADSARVFETMPSQTPAADRAGAFSGPGAGVLHRRGAAAQSAAVFERTSMANKTPQAMEIIRARLSEVVAKGTVPSPVGAGGLARAGKGKPKLAVAPKWVKKEVRAMLPPDTPDWLIAEYVNAAMGRR